MIDLLGWVLVVALVHFEVRAGRGLELLQKVQILVGVQSLMK